MANQKSSFKVAPAKSGVGSIRIIGGLWRGKKLPVLERAGLRPTTDRVKETLFNWLMTEIAGARCLDCFAGSGSLGFEALSRQARSVVMLEKDPLAFKQLQENRQKLATQALEIVRTDALVWLSGVGESFDVVFIDPPFYQDLLAETLTKLEENDWLADEAWIYVESEAQHLAPYVPETWTLHREKQAGQVMSRLYHRQVRSKDEERL